MFENPRRGRQARNFTTKSSENSSSQIVFRTDIFLKIAVGCPCLDGGGKASTKHYATDSDDKDFLTARSHAGIPP